MIAIIDIPTKSPWRGAILSSLAHSAVFLIYSATFVLVTAAAFLREMLDLKMAQRPIGEIQVLATGTFDNEGWVKGHLAPLTIAPAVGKIWVVCDRPWPPLAKVSYIVPPPWLRQVCGRSASRIIMVFATAIQQRPDLLMGYHIMPNSLVCLVAASLLGVKSAYQMTGGPIQIFGGGYRAENSLLRFLGRKSVILERLLYATIRHFDLVVVRGKNALMFAKQHDLGRDQLVITAGIDTEAFRPREIAPFYDAICVSRLVAKKGLEYLLEVLSHCHLGGNRLKVAIVGDGPSRQAILGLIDKYRLSEYVKLLGRRDDINHLLATAKIFVLTSPSEGMSIALLEALAVGLPAAITNVGDLGDAVEEGINGTFLDGENPLTAATQLLDLLKNDADLKCMSSRARHIAKERYSVNAIAQQWNRYLIGDI